MDYTIASGVTAIGSGDTAPVSGTKGEFTSGSPGVTPATVLPGYQMNALVEELINIILAAGLTPSNVNNAQVLAAIKRLGASGSAIQGFAQSLKIQVTGNTALSVSAAALALASSSGLVYGVSGFAATLGTGIAGLNGLDTGTIAASTWYNVWAVSNGTTSGVVLSLSSTAPGSGITGTYPFYARLGAVRTNASSQLLGTLQLGRQTRYVVGGPNVSGLPQMMTGGFGSITAPTWIAMPVAAFVPPTASQIVVACFPTVSASNNEAIVAPNNSYSAALSASNPPPIQSTQGAMYPVPIALESSNIYGATQTNVGILCYGWEDNL